MNTEIDFLVLGATGMQGCIVARYLSENGHRIYISGRNQSRLEEAGKKYKIEGAQALDLNNKEETTKLIHQIRPAVVINCAEGDWNLSVYRSALEGGANVIDLGSDLSATGEQLALNEEFKKKNLVAITGCGSTPGVNNVMLRYAGDYFDSITTIEAGFAWNSNIKTFVVPFSMESIIEEFTEPAPVIENKSWLKKIPLETVRDQEFREVGNQKVFLVRHPETETFFSHYKNKGVENVRFLAGFPKHSFDTIMSYLNHSFTKNDKVIFIHVDGKGEIPLIGLTKVLQEIHPLPKDYMEKENLWVRIGGEKDGAKKEILMECIVPTLPDWKEAGCNIDTGFPASIIGQMILKGDINQYGSFAPEAIVPCDKFFQALNKNNMIILMNGEMITTEEFEKEDETLQGTVQRGDQYL